MKRKLILSAMALGLCTTISAQDTRRVTGTPRADDAAELAKQLSNPVAALISVPFQIGARYYAGKPSGGPDWGLRCAVVLLFPK